jgi:hypothetical protein
VSLAIVDGEGVPQGLLDTRTTTWIQIDVVVREAVQGLDVCTFINTSGGVSVLGEALSDAGIPDIGAPGRYRVRSRLDPVLAPGRYSIDVWLGNAYDDYEWRTNVFTFSVEGSDIARPRLVRLGVGWDVEKLE